MGLDWIESCAKTWTRGWNRSRDELSQPNLFTVDSEPSNYTFRASTVDANPVLPTVGEIVILRSGSNVIDVLSGVQVIGRAETPPEEVLRLLQSAAGCGLGQIVELFPRSSTFDVMVK